MFASPGEIAFSIGYVSIYYYGIIMAIALTVGVLTAALVAKFFYPELKSDVIFNISPVIIISALLGARIYYCVLNLSYYSQNLLEIFNVRQGGLSIHGAILGGLIGGIIYAKKHKLPILKLCDIFSYGLILGQAIGRWGNFFNSEAFGRPTQSFLKLYIPIYKRPLEYMQYNYFHPTFLYESILDLLIFLILIITFLRWRNKDIYSKADTSTSAMTGNKDGIVFFTYLILYSIARILIEQIRIDSILNVFGVPIAQVVSIIIILISIAAIFVIKLKNESSR